MNPINFIFGFLPSLLWLSFYLKEDVKPEPKRLILTVFALGFIVTLPALFFEFLTLHFLSLFSFSKTIFNILKFFLAIALIEEFFKFFVVAIFIFDHPEFEEPVDGMIYMIVSGLGFAAAENLLISLRIVSFPEILEVSILRFLGATFLHALSCGIFGYFLANYYFKTKGKIDIFLGLIFSTLLHGIYNFSIISIETIWQIIFPILILIFASVLVSFLFKRLKQKQKNGFFGEIKKRNRD
jgi:RsiW-degrading membrane proteinase PrsW (M82 family)